MSALTRIALLSVFMCVAALAIGFPAGLWLFAVALVALFIRKRVKLQVLYILILLAGGGTASVLTAKKEGWKISDPTWAIDAAKWIGPGWFAIAAVLLCVGIALWRRRS